MMDTVIVADDSEIMQKIIEESLKDKFNVLKAKNGKEVVSYVTSNNNYNIAGILLDLNMPECDGFVVLEYFKNNNLFMKYPVVIISGDDTKETIERAFKYNIIDMLNKPFGADRVREMVNKMKSYKVG